LQNRDALAQSIARSFNCSLKQIAMRSRSQLLAQAYRDALAQSIARSINCSLNQLLAQANRDALAQSIACSLNCLLIWFKSKIIAKITLANHDVLTQSVARYCLLSQLLA
jgi:hypothetical protein